MKTSELDYELPKELIATEPANPRESARLMVLNRKTKEIIDSEFSELPRFLKPGDLLVFNETKVFPARVYATKETGGKIEVVFLSEKEPKIWEVLIGGKIQLGSKIFLGEDLEGTVLERGEGEFFLRVNKNREEVFKILEHIGHVPLPPYINRGDTKADKKEYQTVFAKKTGSAAAPTASLHFSKKLLCDLTDAGIETTYVTLHVGLGTFAPVKTEDLEAHPIHSEYFEITKEAAESVNRAKKEGRRVIAVGTTVVRTLEAASENGELKPQKRTTKLFICPGYKFQLIDGLITNFHTPKSSLLGLVYAFLGKEATQKAYVHAIKNKYRFFSYGDGMIIL
jgi:S-adenosylmethionine:tRNA ribosyltransferase-isomerase